MRAIGQMLRAFFTHVKAPGDGEQVPAVPAAVAADRLQLLLSCGF